MELNVSIIDFIPEPTQNEFSPLVAQLAELNDDKKAAQIVFDDEKTAKSALAKIQRAANGAGKSARKRKLDQITSGEHKGKWVLIVAIGAKIERPGTATT